MLSSKEVVLRSLHRHRIQPSPPSLPTIYINYSFWESVANVANQYFGINIDAETALGLATQMERYGLHVGKLGYIF